MKFTLRKIFALVVVLALAIFLGVQYSVMKGKGGDKTQVVQAQHQEFVIATGTIEARDDVVLSFEQNGTVKKINYKAGDRVTAGAIIAELDNRTLAAEIEAQRSNLDREAVQLTSVVNGPEEYERLRIEANIGIAQQALENEIRATLSLAQTQANHLESEVHTKVDTLFSGNVENLHYEGDVSALLRQRINTIRKNMEIVLKRWRVWSNMESAGYQYVATITKQFEKDLRLINESATEIYDALLPIRSESKKKEEEFILLSEMRKTINETIRTLIVQVNRMNIARAEHELALAKLNESLAGGTISAKLQQSAQVEVERERLRQLELSLEETRIRAPFSGVVGEIFAEEGEFATTGSNAVRFISREGFSLSVDITEVEIKSVKEGQELGVVVDVTGEELTAKVRTISGTEKRISDVPVYTVVLDITDKQTQLRPGMTVDIHIPVGEPAEVYAVPRGAIQRKGGQEFVLVERGDNTILLPVLTGAPFNGNSVTVTGELRPDDIVILNAGHENK